MALHPDKNDHELSKGARREQSHTRIHAYTQARVLARAHAHSRKHVFSRASTHSLARALTHALSGAPARAHV